MIYLGLFVTSLLYVAVLKAEAAGICENVTRTDEGDTFLFFCGRKNATKAQEYCRLLGGHLVTISNEDEQTEVEDLMGKIEKGCTMFGGASSNLTYIGLSDGDDEGLWKWFNREPFVYSNWRNISKDERCRQQPNGGNQCPESISVDQDYVAIQRCRGKNYGLWFDVRGDAELYFICEVRAGQITSEGENEWELLRGGKFKLNSSSSARSQQPSTTGGLPPTTTTIRQQQNITDGDDNDHGENEQRFDDKEAREHNEVGGDDKSGVRTTVKTITSSKNETGKSETSMGHGQNAQQNGKSPIKNSNSDGNKILESKATRGQSTTSSSSRVLSTASPSDSRRPASPKELLQRPYPPRNIGSERTPPDEDAIHATTGPGPTVVFQSKDEQDSSGTTMRQNTSTDNYEDVTVSSRVINRLDCLLLSLNPQQQDNLFYSKCPMRGLSVFPPSNPIENFELNVAPKAADLILSSKSLRTVSVKAMGAEMKLVPVTKKSLSRRKNPSDSMSVQFGDEDCLQCDGVQLKKNELQVDSGEMVVVTAALKRDVLEGTGVYSSSLVAEAKFGNPLSYDSETFVEKFTSVLCVSVYQRNRKGALVKVNAPATTVFDLRNDTSESRTIKGDHQRRLTSVERKCVFLRNEGNSWEWSDFGCKTHEISSASIRCDCNHTTAFAIMVSLKSFRTPIWLEKTAIFIEVIGIFFLTLTLCLLLWLRRTLKKDRVLTQINLTLALLLLHISMLVASLAVRVEAACIAMTALSHYFMIASFAWMLNEGLVLYKKTCSKALNFDMKKLRIWLLLIGWIFPAVFVVLCVGLGVGFGIYLDETEAYAKLVGRESKVTSDTRRYRHCWLGTRYNMVLAALIPVAVILCVVIFFLIRVSKVVWTMNIHVQNMRPSDAVAKNEALKATVRAVALLIPILGIPWVFSILVNVPGAEIVFAVLHSVVNGLQGVVLFIIYILSSRDVRQTTSRRLTQNTSGRSFSISVSSGGISFRRARTTTSKVDERSSNSPSPIGSPIQKRIKEATKT